MHSLRSLCSLKDCWKSFCIDISKKRNIVRNEKFNDFCELEQEKILEFLIFSPSDFIEYCSEQKNFDLLLSIGQEILQSVSFKFFNASLIYSCSFDEYDYFDKYDNQLVCSEKSNDNYDPDIKENYDFAMREANKINLIRFCLMYGEPNLRDLDFELCGPASMPFLK